MVSHSLECCGKTSCMHMQDILFPSHGKRRNAVRTAVCRDKVCRRFAASRCRIVILCVEGFLAISLDVDYHSISTIVVAGALKGQEHFVLHMMTLRKVAPVIDINHDHSMQ